MFESNKIIKFEVVTPEKVVLKEMVVQATIPTEEGEITVLPDHEPLVAIIKPGVIEIKTDKDEIRVVAVAGGFVEVLRNKIVILADSAERAEEIDSSLVEQARQRAEDSLKDLRDFDKMRFADISSTIAVEMAKTRAISRWRNLKK